MYLTIYSDFSTFIELFNLALSRFFETTLAGYVILLDCDWTLKTKHI